ncbi:MAG: hypothetical protein AB3N64_04940 [Puniceicoccaceae bacterium]
MHFVPGDIKSGLNKSLVVAPLADAPLRPAGFAGRSSCRTKALTVEVPWERRKLMIRYLVLTLSLSPMLISVNTMPGSTVAESSERIEIFEFTSNENSKTGKIFIPKAYEENNYLPAIYLIDYTEQHFKIATDEFEQVIAGLQKLNGVEALVVALDGIPDIDAEPDKFQDDYIVFRDMAEFVSNRYTMNPSRTFIGKGSESGVVLMALFQEEIESSVFENFIATDPSGLYASALVELLESKEIPKQKSTKRLHFSFSTSNDREKCNKVIDLIHKAELPWLVFESEEYTNSDYENTYPISYAEGIAFVFNDNYP